VLEDLQTPLASDEAYRSAQAACQAIVDDLLKHQWLGSAAPL